MHRPPPVPETGIPHFTVRLGERVCSLDDLDEAGLLTSPPELLADFGFDRCHVHPDRDATELVLGAARELQGRVPEARDRISAVFVYSGLPDARPGDPADPLSLFRYDLGRIRHELELDHLPGYRLSQQGCAGWMATIRLAGEVLAATEGTSALVLTGESFGAGAQREILYNLMSDAGSALLVDRHATRNRILAGAEVAQSYYWDTAARSDEILASYFPLAQRVIERALREAGIEADALRWIVPHNVSRRSWEILGDMLDLDPARVWTSNIEEVGHTVTCDHMLNLAAMEAAGALTPGDRLLLFTFGFGSTWSATVLEH